MKNFESNIKSFEKLSKMLVIKPANELFSQFSEMVIDDIKVYNIIYDKDSGSYKIIATVSYLTSLDEYEKMNDINWELCHMFLNAAEYIFSGYFTLELEFQYETNEQRYGFLPDGDRQSNSESLDSIKSTLKFYLE
jgi:hypothetical protein